MTESVVELAIYDLSQGMARSLSAQFLGPNHVIEMIPHTAVVVYGKEYFFGGGIQCCDPQEFRRQRGFYPVQVQVLGKTRVAQRDFEAWCRRHSSLSWPAARYTVQSYDLLHRNCNHFSHDAALDGLKLSKGVPSWVLEVPQRFLSSPMGQLVRPMLEQMQLTGNAPVEGDGSSSFLAESPVSSTSNASAVSTSKTNPWTSLSSSASGNVTIPNTTTTILKKYTQPLLSNDLQSIKLCTSKLSPYLESQEVMKSHLERISQALSSKNSNASQDASRLLQSVEKIVPQLWKLIQSTPKVASFALLYLRLVVLHFPTQPSVHKFMTEVKDQLSNTVWANQQSAFTSSLAWCIASNYCAATGNSLQDDNDEDQKLVLSSLTDAALRDWNPPTAIPVRQAAGTFLYNYVVISNHMGKEEAEEIVVSLLCGALEQLLEETDPTCRLRRLLVISRVVWNVQGDPVENAMAKDLILDLGIQSVLGELIQMEDDESNKASNVAHECRLLVKELSEKLR